MLAVSSSDVAWSSITGKPSWITDSKPSYDTSEIQIGTGFSAYYLSSYNTGDLTNTLGRIGQRATQGWAHIKYNGEEVLTGKYDKPLQLYAGDGINFEFENVDGAD